MIREYSQRVGDEINEVLGSPIYAQSYVFKELRDQVLTPFSTQQLPVSRFYMMLDPKVVVDFEPNPLDGDKLYVDEKRRFFAAENIIYVPVFLRESLTKEQFKERVDHERSLLGKAHQESMEDEALAQAEDETIDPETAEAIDKETHRRVEELKKTRHLFGVALTHTLAKTKRQIIVEILKERANARMGRVGSGS